MLLGVAQADEHCARAVLISLSHTDRKSTRLNSSHGYISYAVFCLKKKNFAKAKLDIDEGLASFTRIRDVDALRATSCHVTDPLRDALYRFPYAGLASMASRFLLLL